MSENEQSTWEDTIFGDQGPGGQNLGDLPPDDVTPPPVVDAPPVDSTPPTDAPPADVPADTPKDTPFLSGKFEGINSEDDIARILSERNEFEQKVQSYQPHKYNHHLAEAIDKYVEAGGTNIEGFLQARSIEPDKLSDREALLQWKIMDKPNLSAEDHKILLDHDYPEPQPLTEEQKEEMTDSEIKQYEDAQKAIKVKQVLLKDEAAQARKKLSDLKTQLQSPEKKVDPEVERNRQRYIADATKATSEFKGLEVPGEIPFNVAMSDSEKAQVQKIVEDPNTLWSLPAFRNQDGSVNFNHVLSVIQFASNPALLKTAGENYMAAAVEKLKNDIQNKSTPGKGADTPPANNINEPWMTSVGIT